jgi:hypothetical protein
VESEDKTKIELTQHFGFYVLSCHSLDFRRRLEIPRGVLDQTRNDHQDNAFCNQSLPQLIGEIEIVLCFSSSF